MAAYRRVYDSHHLQADCQEPGSAPEPCARQSSMGYLYLFRGIIQYTTICYIALFSVVTLLQFLSLGLRHSSSLWLSLLSLLTNTLPGPSASEVTTSRRYTNLFIIIIIITACKRE